MSSAPPIPPIQQGPPPPPPPAPAASPPAPSTRSCGSSPWPAQSFTMERGRLPELVRRRLDVSRSLLASKTTKVRMCTIPQGAFTWEGKQQNQTCQTQLLVYEYELRTVPGVNFYCSFHFMHSCRYLKLSLETDCLLRENRQHRGVTGSDEM